MGVASIIAEAFNKPTSSRVRLILSLLFILLTTAIIMSIFEVVKGIFDPDLTMWESQLYTIVFVSIVAPAIALFVLLKFDNLYQRSNVELQERKRAEEALSNNLAVLIKSQEIAHLGNWTIDFEQGRFELSDELYRIYGFEPGKIEPTLEQSAKLTHPDDMGRYNEYVDLQRREGRLDSIDYQIVQPHGAIRYVHVQTDRVARGPDGRVKTASGITQDITERKRVEEALRGSEAKFRALFEGAGAAIFVADVATGRIIDCNGKAEELIGRPRREIIGLHQTQLHPEYMEEVQREQFSRHARTAGIISDDALVQHRDGRIIPVLINAAPLKVNGQEIMIGYFLDITERKRAEEALRESEAKFRALADTSFGMIAVHRGSNLLYVNDQAVTITGYSKEELLTMKFWELFPADLQKLIMERAFARLKGKSEPTNYETKLVTKEGKTKWVNLTAGLFDYGGEPAIIATLFDITASKDAEAALCREKEQAELYLDLMGHDISNMHQIALGYLEMAQDMHPEIGQRELLEKPIEVMHRSARLISNVRKLQKLREGMTRDRDIDVYQLLTDVQREFGAVPGKAIRLDLNGCDGSRVHANELLHDVFANLVSNAIKHTGDRADISIELNVIDDHDGQYYRVSVEDNGPGVPDDLKAIIFSRTLKGTAKAKGIGLGLYLVKSLVDSYEGRVWVEDRVPGDHTKGARFVVMLPVA